MNDIEVGQLSQKLVDVLNLTDFRPSTNAKDKVTADKLDWLFEYDGFGEFFTYLVNVVTDENVIPAEMLSRYEDLCQTSAADILPSDDVLEVLGSLAKLSLNNANTGFDDGVGLFPGRLMSSAGSNDLVKKEYTLLQSQAESLRRQSSFLQGQLQIERVTLVQKEDLLKAELQETRKLEDKIATAAGDLDDVSTKLLAEVCQLGAFYASEQLLSGEIGSCGIMGGLPLKDIYRMEEDYAAKFTTYTRKQLGHKGVIHLANGAPTERSSRLSTSNGPLSSTTIASNGLDHIRNEELAACFKALTPARASKPANGSSQNKCLSFMRPGRHLMSKYSVGSSRLSSIPSNENHSDGRLTVEEMTVILQEIYADYGLALMERTRSVVERDRLAGNVAFLDNFLSSVEKGELSHIVANLDVNLTRTDRKFVDLKLKMDSAFSPTSSAIAASLDKLVSLSVESVLDCGLDLELKRKEYVLEKREKVIGYLKTICARGLVVRLLLENELGSVTETVRMGESVVDELKNNENARLARKAFFSKSQFALKQLPKYAVDSVNVFVTAFHTLLDSFPFPNDCQLTCCKENNVSVLTLAHVAEHIDHYVENLKKMDKTVSSNEVAILQQTALLTSLINQMRAVLSNDALASSPKTLLANLINRVQREIDVLEAKLTKEIRSVEEMKQHMFDPLVQEERMFFTKFYNPNGNEADLVNEVISDLQTRLSC